MLMAIAPGAPVALRRSLDAGGDRYFAPALQISVAVISVASMPLFITALNEYYAGQAAIDPRDLMRQVFMTALSACLGLVPAALSSGIGTQVQQPLATVVVAGMLLSPICSLLMIPTLSRIFMRPATATGQLVQETM